jgi:serine phosphatase RsbU (regulator of sigma subunit)
MRRYFLNTVPGRAIVIGVALRILVALVGALSGGVPPFLSIVDTVAAVAIAVGLAYFGFQLFVVAKRHLLWRVRRKLILSYLFVGFVPALLIVAFFLLCGFLLFYNISSYLVQSRLRALGDQARFLAQTTALEIQRAGGREIPRILTRRQAGVAEPFPGLSIAVVPVTRTCEGAADVVPLTDVRRQTVGPWAHADAPASIPDWVPCDGFGGVLAYSHRRSDGSSEEDTHLLARGVAFPENSHPSFAVVVDLLVNDKAREQLRRETGIDIRNVRAAENSAAVLAGRAGGDIGETPPPSSTGLSGRFPPSVVESRSWATGDADTVSVFMTLRFGELYDRISGARRPGEFTIGVGLLYWLIFIGMLFVVIEVLAAFAGFSLARSITGSVHQLFMGTERVRQGDFTHRIAIRSDDQLGELAGSFNQMTASIEDLLLQAAEKKRLEEELRIAHEIQMSLLPQGPLVMSGLSVTAVCVPAREVGGDYYDFLPLDDHRVGVLIADVSGKGTSAALYMAELKGLVLSLSRIHSSPRDLLIDANRIIAEHLDARSFITMTYAVIDVRARMMTYARAGHTPLIHVPGPGVDSRRARILAPDGLVLGLKIDQGEMFARLLQEDTIPLHEGDVCLFFTDGISEAMNAHDDCFGEGRLGQLVETHANLRSDELRERVLREIAAFVGDAPQHDDMTMILLKVEESESEKAKGKSQKVHAEALTSNV